jgi:hypothetical protein
VELTADEMSLLAKGPKFSVAEVNKQKVILEMKTGFQKLAHDLRWHFGSQMAVTSQTAQCSGSLANDIWADNRNFPLVSDRKEIILPPLIPVIETVLRTSYNKYLNALKFVEMHRFTSNINPVERNAIRAIKDKGLLAVPSDKGGDLCIIKKVDYDLAISKHIDESPIYRRVSRFDVGKLDAKINEIWFNVCSLNKVPNKVKNMYASTCSSFASVHAVVKTHKSSLGNVVIRPIINSIGSPGYNLSRFLQQIIQPLVNVKSSELIMENIKNLESSLLSERRYPFSLDVDSMFHNIPRAQSINLLSQKLMERGLQTPIPHSDIVRLISVCLSCNHFVFSNNIFYQKDGLPMGNRLSGILADIFIQKVVDELTCAMLPVPILYRYVDDLLVFGRDESDARTTLESFNSNCYGIKFSLELPVDGSLPYLDFSVKVSPEGEPCFSFFKKPMRKDVFLNASSAFPKKSVENVVRSEVERIVGRCSDPLVAEHHKNNFINVLEKNGHKPQLVRSWLNKPVRRPKENTSNEKFFLSIPFVNEETDRKIRNSLAPLGVNVIIAHKGKKLKNQLGDSRCEQKCSMANCKLNNQLCMRKGVVYLLQCPICMANYIGSSWRHLHTRYKEHLTHKSSAVYAHNQTCIGTMSVSVLASDVNIQRMRVKEALLIKQIKPSLNTKDDLFGAHILFDS